MSPVGPMIVAEPDRVDISRAAITAGIRYARERRWIGVSGGERTGRRCDQAQPPGLAGAALGRSRSWRRERRLATTVRWVHRSAGLPAAVPAEPTGSWQE